MPVNRRGLLRALAALPVIGTTLAEAMAKPAEFNELAAERVAELASRPTRGPSFVLDEAFTRRIASGEYSLLNLRSLTWRMANGYTAPYQHYGQSRTVSVRYDPEKMTLFSDWCAVFDNDESRPYKFDRVVAYYGRDERVLGWVPIHGGIELLYGNTLTLDFSARGVFTIS